MSNSSSKRRRSEDRAAVSLRFGQWFEAHATGWGVLVVGLIALAALAMALWPWL